MAVPPTGILNLPLLHLANLIAESAAFRSWTSTGSPATAAVRIHRHDYPKPAPLPFAMVAIPSEAGNPFDFTRVSRRMYQSGYSLKLDFWAAYDWDLSTSQKDQLDVFYNTVGAVLSDMLRLAGTTVTLGLATDIKTMQFETCEIVHREAMKNDPLYHSMGIQGLVTTNWGAVV